MTMTTMMKRYPLDQLIRSSNPFHADLVLTMPLGAQIMQLTHAEGDIPAMHVRWNGMPETPKIERTFYVRGVADEVPADAVYIGLFSWGRQQAYVFVQPEPKSGAGETFDKTGAKHHTARV